MNTKPASLGRHFVLPGDVIAWWNGVIILVISTESDHNHLPGDHPRGAGRSGGCACSTLVVSDSEPVGGCSINSYAYIYILEDGTVDGAMWVQGAPKK